MGVTELRVILSKDMNKDSYIYIAGANEMVSSAIARELVPEGYSNIIKQ